MKQREIPIMNTVETPKYAPADVVAKFQTYRDAVVWCWANRPCHGMREDMDQALCAKTIGLHVPHMSRCVNPSSKSPMQLNPDYLDAFETYTGWKAASQWIAAKSHMTVLEQVIAERNAA